MNRYAPRYGEWLERAGADPETLPPVLQVLIQKFENAINAWQHAGTEKQQELLPVLLKCDAVIAVHIYGLYKDRLENELVDKVKLMALKAKALQLKWKK